MLRMLLRRLFLGLLTVFIVSLIIFAGVEILPGSTCTAYLEQEAKGKLLENCRNDLGRKRIAELVGNRLKNSVLLAFSAFVVGVPLAIFLGVVAALRRDALIIASVYVGVNLTADLLTMVANPCLGTKMPRWTCDPLSHSFARAAGPAGGHRRAAAV